MVKSARNYNENNIHIIFLVYWSVLVIWQNVNFTSERSGFSMLIKLFLIGMLSVYCLFHAKYVSRNIILWILMVFNLFFSFLTEQILTSDVMISYLYIILFVFLTLIIGRKYTINKRQFLFSLNWIIVMVAYMAIYAVIFCTDQFASAFTITNAYGNELSSFFVSSHEYGLYLVGGITSCLLCLKLSDRKLPYILALILFIPNLMLTYSRTSIIGMLCILAVYMFLNRNDKLKKYIFWFCIVFAAAIYFFPIFRTFVFSVVFKGNNLSERDVLFNLAVEYFKNGTLLQKIWGHGIYASRYYFQNTASHGSVHNAYLQVLIYYGIVGLFFLVAYLGSQFYANVKLMKKDRFWGVMFIAILLMCSVVMFTNTACIFNSPCDSFFLTIFAVLIPKYVRNAIQSGEGDL